MNRTVDVAFRHEDARGAEFGAVAVIDTLRATTTMTTILERGAVAIRPVADLDEAYALKNHDPLVLLGGERDNRPPEGFDGGNSPADWPKARVQGHRVIFTTTNGTRAIDQVRSIPRLVLGSLINAEAASRYLWELERPTLLVASGTQGRPALEDVLACGAMAVHWPRSWRTDAAEIACALFHQESMHLGNAVRQSAHGKRLAELGLDADLAYASHLNRSSVVPVLCSDGWLRSGD